MDVFPLKKMMFHFVIEIHYAFELSIAKAIKSITFRLLYYILHTDHILFYSAYVLRACC